MNRTYYSLLLCLLLLGGCARHQYIPEPVTPEDVYRQVQAESVDSIGFKEFLEKNQLVTNEWPIRNWDLQQLMLAMLYFNPDVDVAMESISVELAKEITAAQRINPQLNIPLEYHSDTSDDRSPWLIGFLLDFVYEREGKREARQQQAQAETEFAKIKVEQTAWQLQEQLIDTYLNYYAALTKQDLISQEIKLRQEAVDLLVRRQQLGEASSFEVSTSRLDYQRSNLLLTEQQTNINDHYQSLLATLGLNPEAFTDNEILFVGIEVGLNDQYTSKPGIQELALQNRSDIRMALQQYQVYEAALRLEIEKQYPDITLSPGFIFDQDDKIWALGAAWLLPMFHHNDGPIAEALARRKLMQVQFKQLQTVIINNLSKAWSGYQYRLDAYRQSLELLKEVSVRQEQIRKQYELGYTDRLDYIQSSLETIKLKQASFDLKVDVIRAFYHLQSTIQTPLSNDIKISDLVIKLIEMKFSSNE